MADEGILVEEEVEEAVITEARVAHLTVVVPGEAVSEIVTIAQEDRPAIITIAIEIGRLQGTNATMIIKDLIG